MATYIENAPFRFYYFLWWADGTSDKPTLEQLQRWILFSMRWPQVVRWLRLGASSLSTNNGSSVNITKATSRLKWLEDSCAACESETDWLKKAQEDFNLDSEAVPWINDLELYDFLKNESERNMEERLSAGVGRGFW